MGLQYLFASIVIFGGTLILAGIIQTAAGLFRLGIVCTYDTPFRNVRIFGGIGGCQWISNCDFLIPIRHVQK